MILDYIRFTKNPTKAPRDAIAHERNYETAHDTFKSPQGGLQSSSNHSLDGMLVHFWYTPKLVEKLPEQFPTTNKNIWQVTGLTGGTVRVTE